MKLDTAGKHFEGRERRWRIPRQSLTAPRMTCPPSSGSPWAIFSTVVTETMAEHAMVLAESIKVTDNLLTILSRILTYYISQINWNSSLHPLPDLMLLIAEEVSLSDLTIQSLERLGWRVCRVEMPQYLKTGTSPEYHLSYIKLLVWAMVQYTNILWLDTDTLVVQSLDQLFLTGEKR